MAREFGGSSVSQETAAATKQSERAVAHLGTLSQQLHAAVEKYRL
jgi:methyl-accepting chemotaxis protein